jgi:hypothetical protein
MAEDYLVPRFVELGRNSLSPDRESAETVFPPFLHGNRIQGLLPDFPALHRIFHSDFL